MLTPRLRDVHEANRASWNAAVLVHNSHKGDQARFLRGGGSTLFAEEVALLGSIDGARLLHLQCCCGQDSLSLARRGAVVTGVDISDQAIDFARHLAARTAIPATFVRADLYDWLAAAPTREGETAFDLVYSSYGALPYLSSLARWAQLVHGVLVPGGRLVMIEFHPLLAMYDAQGRLSAPYSDPGNPHRAVEGVPDYVGHSGPGLAPGGFHAGIVNFKNPYPAHTFHWGLGELLDALVGAGLRITTFREYPYTNGRRYFAGDELTSERRVLPPPHLRGLPMMFGLVACREG